ARRTACRRARGDCLENLGRRGRYVRFFGRAAPRLSDSAPLVPSLGVASRGDEARARLSLPLAGGSDGLCPFVSATGRLLLARAGSGVRSLCAAARGTEAALRRGRGSEDAVSELERYRAVLAYVGTDFAGWQIQKNAPRTVQAVLEKALLNVAGLSVRALAA